EIDDWLYFSDDDFAEPLEFEPKDGQTEVHFQFSGKACDTFWGEGVEPKLVIKYSCYGSPVWEPATVTGVLKCDRPFSARIQLREIDGGLFGYDDQFGDTQELPSKDGQLQVNFHFSGKASDPFYDWDGVEPRLVIMHTCGGGKHFIFEIDPLFYISTMKLLGLLISMLAVGGASFFNKEIDSPLPDDFFGSQALCKGYKSEALEFDVTFDLDLKSTTLQKF
ncbi:hypothetical protein PRIPAC_84659, partial [Pristionchus pacificus]|uniref:Uncharacterized protein n=1 Tax=Pristionchus pacificus TaxID=54126 RepID=A0A2A6BUA9_PRIPA